MTTTRTVLVDGVLHRITTDTPITDTHAAALVRAVETCTAQREADDAEPGRALTRARERAVLDEQDAVYRRALGERYDRVTVAAERKAA